MEGEINQIRRQIFLYNYRPTEDKTVHVHMELYGFSPKRLKEQKICKLQSGPYGATLYDYKLPYLTQYKRGNIFSSLSTKKWGLAL
jgi:hypothetical protein